MGWGAIRCWRYRCSRVDREFGTSLQMTDLVQHPTIADLATQLRDESAPRAALPAVEIQPGGSRPPLFFIPCIFGSLMTIRALAARLDFDQPVFGLQPLGVDGCDEPHESMQDLAKHYLEQVRRCSRGPYYLLGYSLGGTMAFEMSRQLDEAGETVGLLLLVDAPCRDRPWIVRKGQQAVEKLGPHGAAVFRRLAGAKGMPAMPAPHNARMIAAHRRALIAYHARPYHGPTVIFRA